MTATEVAGTQLGAFYRVVEGDGWGSLNVMPADYGFAVNVQDEHHDVFACFGPSGSLVSAEAAVVGGKVTLELDTFPALLTFLHQSRK